LPRASVGINLALGRVNVRVMVRVRTRTRYKEGTLKRTFTRNIFGWAAMNVEVAGFFGYIYICHSGLLPALQLASRLHSGQ